MAAYILRRLLLIIPTLIGILTINFLIIQAAPGGPVEQTIAQLQGISVGATARISGAQSDLSTNQPATNSSESSYRGASGLDPELVKEIEALYFIPTKIKNKGGEEPTAAIEKAHATNDNKITQYIKEPIQAGIDLTKAGTNSQGQTLLAAACIAGLEEVIETLQNNVVPS